MQSSRTRTPIHIIQQTPIIWKVVKGHTALFYDLNGEGTGSGMEVWCKKGSLCRRMGHKRGCMVWERDWVKERVMTWGRRWDLGRTLCTLPALQAWPRQLSLASFWPIGPVVCAEGGGSMWSLPPGHRAHKDAHGLHSCLLSAACRVSLGWIWWTRLCLPHI